MRRALDALDPVAREVVRLHVLECRTFTEIAGSHVFVSAEAARKCCERARKAMRRTLAGHAP